MYLSEKYVGRLGLLKIVEWVGEIEKEILSAYPSFMFQALVYTGIQSQLSC